MYCTELLKTFRLRITVESCLRTELGLLPVFFSNFLFFYHLNTSIIELCSNGSRCCLGGMVEKISDRRSALVVENWLK